MDYKIAPEECKTCKELTEYFLSNNPGRKGQALCDKCIEAWGIVPLWSPIVLEKDILGEMDNKISRGEFVKLPGGMLGRPKVDSQKKIDLSANTGKCEESPAL